MSVERRGSVMPRLALARRLPVLALAVLTLACALTACRSSRHASQRTAPTISSPTAAPGAMTTVADAPNSASRIVFWTSAAEVLALSDADLDTWKGRGVGGFVAMVGYLEGMGGGSSFTPDANTESTDPSASLQLTLRNSRLAARAHARGMKVYLGMYLSNAHNTQTPLAEWFDDAAWSSIVDPAVDGFVTEAAVDRFDGIAIDQELYPQDGNERTATWNADYPRRTQPEDAVRVQARRRGAHVMHTILDRFPHAEILVYGTAFPETFDSIVQKEVNDVKDAYRDSVQIDFWDGMTSTDGYDAIRFVNALFYKVPQRGSWDEALRYDVNAFYAVASRHFSNWGNASSHVFESPFSWIDSGTSKFERSRSPDAVRQQLDAFRKWGTGGEFANYAQQSLSTFDYAPYVTALLQAAKPAVVDRDVPTLKVASPAPHGSTLDLNGTADDNLGVRVVRWSTPDGATGVATMTFDVPGNDVGSVGRARMHWHIAAIPLRPASNSVTVTVEDIKGNATSQTVIVDG